jgi:hypothetical protein
MAEWRYSSTLRPLYFRVKSPRYPSDRRLNGGGDEEKKYQPPPGV